MIAGGSVIAQVHDRSALEVVSAVDEVDLGNLEIDQPVRIESDSFIGRELEGRVASIAPIIRRAGDARVCDVTIGFTDSDALARVGASCTIYVTVRDLPDAPAIPIESYFVHGGKKYVYLVTEEPEPDESDAEETEVPTYLLEQREVETGIIGLERVEVVSGLELGDRIVARNVQGLVDGQAVTLMPGSGNDTAP
jgi:multidrug efflux pump subunit AcrA (membrane-fusion protein)